MGQKMSKNLPIIVILGSTGTGKTKLSLELASKFNGEIIGADSMQVYKGLDIASAKATPEELAQAPHHMINILKPQEMFTVLEYRNRVLPIISDVFERNKIPIIVGGTNYYIESILWNVLVQQPDEIIMDPKDILPNKEHELPSVILHEKLKQLDPAMANRLHPNNKRKILRALEILQQKGKKLSEILEEQCVSSKSGGNLRYDNALVFWLQCNQKILDKRLDDRINQMIKEGLIDELFQFHKLYNEKRLNNDEDADYTIGIFQSIGFKEFHDYLILSESERHSETGEKMLKNSIERLKIVTRRYARKQTKWTVNRFLCRKDRQVPPIYNLDTTNVAEWDENVRKPAMEILENYISGRKCSIEPLTMLDKVSVPNVLDQTYKCETCDKILVGEHQFSIHMKSQRHKKASEKSNKL
ncbi:hypothetical protein ABEB36_001011 [Hypothenemus hampei]|uniref:C2H2-type domain-containing protein n=1 Tax=Hypothenemus hampei TaxID=57062 RepID=A0ABD1FGR3_HYPHA